jgi:hypothetical protein
MFRVSFAAALALVVATGAQAAEPGGTGPGSTLPQPLDVSPTRDPGRTAHSAALPGIDISGRVVDAAGRPFGDVRVKLFADGLLVEHARTASDGTFLLQGNPPRDEGTSVDLWFESPDAEKWLDVHAIVRQANVPGELSADCTPRVNLMQDAGTIEVTMRTAEQQQEFLKSSQCLQGGAMQGPAGP